MADAKHTPGPWAVEFNRNTDVAGVELSFAIHGRRLYIATGQSSEHMKTDGQDDDPILAAECEANARLIAAAPDLLAFVQSLIDDYRSEDGMDEPKTIVRHAQELVAKALGEQA